LAKNLNTPDETLQMPGGLGVGAVVAVGGMTVTRAVAEPGWRWSEVLKPVAGTVSCQVPHTGVLLAGHLHVEMDDGTTADLTEGDVYVIPPGHDAWVVGDEQVRMLDWSAANPQFNAIVREAAATA
jgi:hypothetical protein